ncbi:MAG: hypothetical protein KAG53_10035 [Endozoicomonadaceae bacterium]|nr:hypothetical protein [Endozoicomonadaceae bacterium]
MSPVGSRPATGSQNTNYEVKDLLNEKEEKSLDKVGTSSGKRVSGMSDTEATQTTGETNKAPDSDIANRNADSVDESESFLSIKTVNLDDAIKPTKVSASKKKQIEKHCFIWVAFQKIKRYFHTLTLNNDPSKLTSKDFKKIPDNLATDLSFNEPFKRTVTSYNDLCDQLEALEKKEALSVSNANTTLYTITDESGKDKDSSINESKGETTNSEIPVENESKEEVNILVVKKKLSEISSKIFTYFDVEKKDLSAELKDLFVNENESDHGLTDQECVDIANLVKSKFGFNPKKMAPDEDDPVQQVQLLSHRKNTESNS